MFIKPYQLFFLFFLIGGTRIAVSSNSWFTCWVGLEINLISLIPLILRELNFKSTEAAIKYFLAQAIASVILISAGCIETIYGSRFFLRNFRTIIFISMAIKAGLAPFHLWFPQVINCVSWFKCLIILTWQKIAPFALIRCFNNKKIIYIFIMSAALTGALGGLNQINTKILLTYSSIAHSAWIIIITSISLSNWALYFSLYVLIVAPIVASFFKINLSKVTEIYKTKISPINKNIFIFLILSLGGLPPFLGFSAKLTAIIIGLKIFSVLILLILITSSLVSLFFYIKIFYNLSINSSMETKINLNRETLSPNIMLPISIGGNIVISTVVLLI